MDVKELGRLARLFTSSSISYVCTKKHIDQVVHVIYQTNQQIPDVQVAKNILRAYQAHFLSACDEVAPDVVDDCVREAKEKGGLVLRRCERLLSHDRRLELTNNNVSDFIKAFEYALRRFAEGLRQAVAARSSQAGYEGFSPLMSELLEEFGGVYVFGADFVKALNSHAFTNSAAQIKTLLKSGDYREAANGWVKFGRGRSNVRIYGSVTSKRPRIITIIPNRDKDKRRMDALCSRVPASQYPFQRVA